MLARGKACCAEPGELEGSHHGNALMCAAGWRCWTPCWSLAFFAQVRITAATCGEGLGRLAGRYGQGEVRGARLLLGLGLTCPKKTWPKSWGVAALHEGLLLNARHADVVRLSPALTVSKGQHRRNAAAPGPRLRPPACPAAGPPKGPA
ncbi:hypothetical protein [Pseudomonas peli]|uniref:hypothetical protein n=1 Tax=Pseudomonas peli TaxID=592361 RepID=UPI0024AD1215|nr:hypothetical protein [Pseudomonas peli]